MTLLALTLLACSPKDPTPEASPVEPVATEAPAAAPSATATLGAPAPDFTLPSVQGEPVTLSANQGKVVVLEWYNPDCPFVKYAHGAEGPLASLPQKWLDQGVVWLAINSGAPGKQGAGQERNLASLDEYGIAYPVLLDEDGAVGRTYEAKTTPHVYIVDPEGTLIYRGGLDNAPLGKPKGEATVSYVDDTLGRLTAGEAVETAETKPYGCSVKYDS
ncbi:MAG: redoxin domain-containing protein [Alphaproteobacteria bacterium]|nr:redoxin domain-containing protein [Alphaproteobacteria bacterium]